MLPYRFLGVPLACAQRLAGWSLPGSARRVMDAILLRTLARIGSDGRRLTWTDASNAELAAETGLHARVIRRAVRRLEAVSAVQTVPQVDGGRREVRLGPAVLAAAGDAAAEAELAGGQRFFDFGRPEVGPALRAVRIPGRDVQRQALAAGAESAGWDGAVVSSDTTVNCAPGGGGQNDPPGEDKTIPPLPFNTENGSQRQPPALVGGAPERVGEAHGAAAAGGIRDHGEPPGWTEWCRAWDNAPPGRYGEQRREDLARLEELARTEGQDVVFHAAVAFRELGRAGRVRQVDLRRFLTAGIMEGLRACAKEKAQADRQDAGTLEESARAIARAEAQCRYRWKWPGAPETVEARYGWIMRQLDERVARAAEKCPAGQARQRARAEAWREYVTGKWRPALL